MDRGDGCTTPLFTESHLSPIYRLFDDTWVEWPSFPRALHSEQNIKVAAHLTMKCQSNTRDKPQGKDAALVYTPPSDITI